MIKKIVYERDDHKCVKCGNNENLNVHHKTYKHLFDEYGHLEDLETLCKECHKEEHFNNRGYYESEIEERNVLIEKVLRKLLKNATNQKYDQLFK